MKNKFLIVFLLSLNICYAQINSKSESIKDKAFLPAINKAQKYLDSLQTAQNIPGLSVAVGNARGIIWAQGLGFADLESRIPVSIHSRFRIGSVSKSLTSVALGRLLENGKFNMDTAIQAYVPQFPLKKYTITARQLVTHTSGIRHYRNDDPITCPKRYISVTEALSIFNQDSLLFQPGSKYNYSTYGYTLLSAALEGASGQDYLSLMKTSVFSPLGMTETSPDYSDSLINNRVRFYELKNGKHVHAGMVDNSYKWAGGGFLSTPTDLVKLGTELIKHSILKKETIDILLTTQVLNSGENTNYAAGWRIGHDDKGRKIIHHGGLIDGGRTFLIVYPENDLVIAVTANISGARINLGEMDAIANCFFSSK
ncbi:serine hydrolase [Dyadobacter sp. CY312]|uniref:serine hydrolase domain-containing protein n=1 Tax=Dyadobacter sp. CY312 TaxID=2907303 RepID=UPI001F17B95D|nr:serine hydrolase domain-containing protein [Dyadobacter sp. CY312]MCE7043291.1 beta-lactamase family protein [Dyadobacter sp. CY312]